MFAGGFFRQIRILLLLLTLFAVALNAWLTHWRSTSWERSLWMAVYPINGDGSQATQRYIDSLTTGDFGDIETFLAAEAHRYGVTIAEPVTVRLAIQVRDLPPPPPADGATLAIMLWSLKLRYWAYRHDAYAGPSPDIRMFVVYHDPRLNDRLRHSLGLQKGMIGVVNAFASRPLAARNNVVITHELLHTVGATDKYDPANNQPLFPQGYAEPRRQPLYPQRLAEIMGGRIPLSPRRAVMPKSLQAAAIGRQSAREIRWID